MLDIQFPSSTPRTSRRGFLRIGGLAAGGLTLADVLRIRALAKGATGKKRAVICFWLDGGPPQHETFDPKPDAPVEFRGAYDPIETALPGLRFSEWYPRIAQVADKLNVIRSAQHTTADHYAGCHWMWTGYFGSTFGNPAPQNPCIGSIVSKELGPNRPGVPAFVSIPKAITNNMAPGYQAASYLGVSHNAFEPGGDPNSKTFQVRNLKLPAGLGKDRLSDRMHLLAGLDRIRRDVDSEGVMDATDDFHRQAFQLVTGREMQRAFDLESEDPALREQYGRNRIGQAALLARRLVETGVTFVTVNSIPGAFDHHQDLHKRMIVYSQPFDAAIATLVEDLIQRGMYDDVVVLVMGDFGRTPKMNANGGRDHWGSVFPVLLAGGGLKAGQVIGASDSQGAYPTQRPVSPAEILHTVYHQIGIDAARSFTDHAGRPVPILGDGQPITELL